MTDNTENVEATHDEENFSREYVEELRSESAAKRVAAREAEERAQRLLDTLRQERVRVAAASILQDPSDLGEYSDEWDDEDGLPDAEKISAAARALVEAKPYLAKERGDVGQGYRDEPQELSLVDLMRR